MALVGFSHGATIITYLGPEGEAIGALESREVDFDGDDVAELILEAEASQFKATAASHASIQVIPATPPNLGGRAVPLGEGDLVSSTPLFGGSWVSDPLGSTLRVCASGGIGFPSCSGSWPTGDFTNDSPSNLTPILGEPAFLAVRFEKDAQTHYGFVEIGVISFSPTGQIYSYGWEDTPNTPITTIPEPSSVLLLLLGNIALVRRKRNL